MFGHEQQGVRPAIVLTVSPYNGKTELAVVCPITNQAKGYPFEVILPAGLPVTGAVLVDQVKTIDWVSRTARKLGTCPPRSLAEVDTKLRTLVFSSQLFLN